MKKEHAERLLAAAIEIGGLVPIERATHFTCSFCAEDEYGQDDYVIHLLFLWEKNGTWYCWRPGHSQDPRDIQPCRKPDDVFEMPTTPPADMSSEELAS